MKSIVLLGHGVGVKFVIDSLLKNNKNYRVIAVFTHPFKEHKRDLELIERRKDIYGEYAYNVFNLKQDYDIDVHESDNINTLETVSKIKSYNPAYIISIGCRNILKVDFLREFPQKVLNIHTTPLPTYRGAASDSWMILNNELGKEKYGCMHYIDSGIDTGDIIAKSYYTIPKKSYPIDVFKSRMDVFHDIIIKGITNLEDPNFIPEKQDSSRSTTFPRLYTPKDGHIDFNSYSGDELIRFILAFGYPFEGAFCFLEDQKINILDAEFCSDLSFHSFSHGLIFGKNENNEYKVSVKGGYIIVKKVEINGVFTKQSKVFRLGKYLK
ncbi:hypothetical protein MWU58_03185 [Flavobacteriaceae bacterium S0825]|uniref:methionyl-tRNA formyltransferase n=1 Tax=Gaetbulibacter sp. S0825 TaxID=2720084 RepID=UPI001430EFE6|nr:formyltransferase family protein [Gaetbulibacter sp. S0825]MCK0108282.1 hypothetical protein [Flavobacteriaceae bacterium S0825]NIX63918.1 hypothetical protein [Gaetbulibacter sp. S0825]